MVSRFCDAVSDEMAEPLSQDGLNDAQIFEVVASACKFRWDKMEDHAKAIYQDLAEQDMDRYQNELAAYQDQQLSGDDDL